jgi:hypothetical protein
MKIVTSEPSSGSRTMELADRVLGLFQDYCALAKAARDAENRIVRAETVGSVPETLYRDYEEILAKATDVQARYSEARQQLRDYRAEKNSDVSLSGNSTSRPLSRSTTGCS